MTIQFLLELPNVPKIDPRERIFLDVCFSAAASKFVEKSISPFFSETNI